MNNARRQEIAGIINKLEDLLSTVQASQSVAESLVDEMESVCCDEQDYFDSMPEGLQGSEKGELAQSAIDALTEANSLADSVTTLLEDIESVISKLEEAKA